MNGEYPPTPPTGWTPTTSTVGGGVLGGAVAQVIIALIEALAHVKVDSMTAAAIATICIAVIGYFFPDGGRK